MNDRSESGTVFILFKVLLGVVPVLYLTDFIQFAFSVCFVAMK